MDQSRILLVGLNVHKEDSIDIALAEASRDASVRHMATVASGVAVTKALRRLISMGHGKRGKLADWEVVNSDGIPDKDPAVYR